MILLHSESPKVVSKQCFCASNCLSKTIDFWPTVGFIYAYQNSLLFIPWREFWLSQKRLYAPLREFWLFRKRSLTPQRQIWLPRKRLVALQSNSWLTLKRLFCCLKEEWLLMRFWGCRTKHLIALWWSHNKASYKNNSPSTVDDVSNHSRALRACGKSKISLLITCYSNSE